MKDVNAWIAAQASGNSSVKITVNESSGITWLTHEKWATFSGFLDNYFWTEKLKDYKNIILTKLSNGPASIRIRGLEGIGKSRLVFEILKREDLKDRCRYCDLDYIRNDMDVTFPLEVSEGQDRLILVVNHCPHNIHNLLCAFSDEKKYSIISLNADEVSMNLPTHVIEIQKEDGKEVVCRMTEAALSSLKMQDIGSCAALVCAYSENLPKIAKMILQTGGVPSKDDLKELKYIEHLMTYIDERQSDLKFRSFLYAMSMFAEVGGTQEKWKSQKNAICELFCKDVSEKEANNYVQILSNKKILRFSYHDFLCRFSPPLVGAHLAEEFIGSMLLEHSAESIRVIIEKLDQVELLDPLLNRLLPLKGDAVEKFRELLTPFVVTEYRIPHGNFLLCASKIFCDFSKTAEALAGSVVKKVLTEEVCSELRLNDGAYERTVSGLVTLAWYQSHFYDAAKRLCWCSVSEDALWASYATDRLRQLFKVLLSGTSCPPKERLKLLEELLQSKREKLQKLAVDLFGSVLDYGHYWKLLKMPNLLDLKEPKASWVPSSSVDILDYWDRGFMLLSDYILHGGMYQDEAKKIIGNDNCAILRTSLLLRPEVVSKLEELIRYFDREWYTIKEAIQSALKYAEHLKEEHKSVLRHLLEQLYNDQSPLKTKLYYLVSHPGYEDLDAARENAKKLADDIIEDSKEFTAEIKSILLQGYHQEAWAFGYQFGWKCSVDKLRDMFAEIFSLWREVHNDRNANFPSGIMSGMWESPIDQEEKRQLRAELLSQVREDSETLDLFVPLSLAVNPVPFDDTVAVLELIQEGKIEPDMLRALIQGLPLESYTDGQLLQLCQHWERMMDAVPDSVRCIFHLFDTYLRLGAWKYKEVFRPLIRKLLCSSSITEINESWAKLATFELRSLQDKAREHDWVSELFRFAGNVFLKQENKYDAEPKIQDLCDKFHTSYPEACLQMVNILLEGSPVTFTLNRIFKTRDGDKTWFCDIPDAYLVAWLENHRSYAERLLELLPLCRVSGDDCQWIPCFEKLVNLSSEAGDTSRAMRSIRVNWGSYSIIGSSVPYWKEKLKMAQSLNDFENEKIRSIGAELESFVHDQLSRAQEQEKNDPSNCYIPMVTCRPSPSAFI